MRRGDVSEPARRFLQAQIHSVRELEALLALRASADAMTAADLAAALRIGRDWTQLQLERFVAGGVMSAIHVDGDSPRYRYRPQSPELSEVVDEIAGLFQSRRAAIVALIFEDSTDRG